jgi:purine-binding chemotaxis protein CheW
MAILGGNAGLVRLLVCRVGAKVCALPLEHLLETMRPLPTEPLARLPEFVLGLALIRGRPTPVLDARALLGSPREHAPGRYVILDLTGDGARVAALAVDAVLGVRDVRAERLAELPSLLRLPDRDVVAAVAPLDTELLLLLERAQLLPDELWQRLEQERASA